MEEYLRQEIERLVAQQARADRDARDADEHRQQAAAALQARANDLRADYVRVLNDARVRTHLDAQPDAARLAICERAQAELLLKSCDKSCDK